ncbi:MAG: PEP-CTERM sorting domain-containing protein, partial [Akkermansiaceae bacterium]
SENADGLTAGTSTLQDSTNWNASAGDYGVVAGAAIFTTNHFELTAPGTNFNFANRDEGSRTVMTFSADFADLGGSTSTDAGVRLAYRHTPSGSTFFDITAASLADNTVVRYDYVFNATVAAVLYEDGATSIPANTVQLWADGAMVGSKAITNANGSSAIGIGIWNRRPDNAFLMDNLEVRDTAYFSAIPEPSSLALAALGLAGLARRRRS